MCVVNSSVSRGRRHLRENKNIWLVYTRHTTPRVRYYAALPRSKQCRVEAVSWAVGTAARADQRQARADVLHLAIQIISLHLLRERNISKCHTLVALTEMHYYRQ